jgi:hypothetical protein
MERKALAIYLNDHLAGATAGVELARRSAKNNQGTEFGEFLRGLSQEIEADRETLRSVMAELGVRADRTKLAAAWGSEKIGRLKPNGRFIGYSPLSLLVELEFLHIGITGKLAMWSALQDAVEGPLASCDLEASIERAQRQRSVVEQYRLRAANQALGTVRTSAPSAAASARM